MLDLDSIKEYLRNYDGEERVIMEVCGTHTAAISENGIANMLSPRIRLVSGPGCPVCVTVASYIDKLVSLAMEENTTVVSFGDMLRVKGSALSLGDASAMGGSVKMVYSPFEIFDIAAAHPETLFIFAAVGFETTTPIYAMLTDRIVNEGIKNIKLLTAVKTMPAAIRAVRDGITGFIAPGHVSVITGHKLFDALAQELDIPFVTAGFSGGELLAAICALVKANGGVSYNMYPSAVTYEGNIKAQEIVKKYFILCDAPWRGLGIIENSGMRLRDEYAAYDAGSASLTEDKMYNAACSCGDVISGRKSPHECTLFGTVCTPDSPCGACMVSMEGACFHYFVSGRTGRV